MRVIPVLDLVAGRAVRACRGSREAYAPVHSALLSEEQAGDALALARAFRDRLGQGDQGEWYVADLDAITGAAPQRALLRALAAPEALELRAIEVEVEENFGQSATYRESLE